MDVDSARSFDLNAIGADFIENPHPTLAALREHDPLHANPDGSLYLTRMEDVRFAYRHPAMLSDKTRAYRDKFGSGPLYTHHTTSLIFNDPPYHTVVRKLLAHAFTPRKLAEMEPLIGAIVDRLLDDIAREETVDIVDRFAKRLPTEVISFMLGVPLEHRDRLRGYSLAILGALDPSISRERLAAGNEAVAEFGALLSDLIDHRRDNRDRAAQGEVLEALIFGEHDGRRLSQDELVQNCIFLLNAGHETTTSLVANAVGAFMANKAEHRRLVADPSLAGAAVEEVLRFESPLQIGNRLASRDIDMPSGGTVRAGTYIHTSIAAANRDPSEFGEPDRFDITRRPNRHIAFITGIHVCLGATLARYEGRIAFEKLFTRFPDMEATGEAVRMPLARFRGWNRFDVALRG